MNVFLLPHQDDEIGILHMIDECMKSRRPLLVAYVTNGAWRSASAATRNAESKAVLSRLGLADDCIWFLGDEDGVADQGLRFRLEQTLSRLLARLTAGSEITAIYTPAWEGGHVDHDACALLAVALARKLRLQNKVRQFPMYSAYRCRWRPYTVLDPIREAGPVTIERIPGHRRAEHLRLCLMYRSQLKAMLGLFPFILMHYILRGTQQYQYLDPAVVAGRPHEGPLLYERRGNLSWREFEEETAAFRTQYLD